MRLDAARRPPLAVCLCALEIADGAALRGRPAQRRPAQPSPCRAARVTDSLTSPTPTTNLSRPCHVTSRDYSHRFTAACRDADSDPLALVLTTYSSMVLEVLALAGRRLHSLRCAGHSGPLVRGFDPGYHSLRVIEWVSWDCRARTEMGRVRLQAAAGARRPHERRVAGRPEGLVQGVPTTLWVADG